MFRKKGTGRQLDPSRLPLHVGIIMDGNGRWAKKRGLPRNAGHREGARTFRVIANYCRDIGIRYLTVYAFSTENWSRPADEVNGIMALFRQYLDDLVYEGENKERIRLRFIGDRSCFSGEMLEEMEKAERETAKNTEMTLNIAINYGGRDEIVRAVRRIAEDVRAGSLSSDEITEATVGQYLDTAGQPDVDLLIRPSGEFRSSNFLLWQAHYAEMVFMDVLWPDFTPEKMNEALRMYAGRSRRFGGIESK